MGRVHLYSGFVPGPARSRAQNSNAYRGTVQYPTEQDDDPDLDTGRGRGRGARGPAPAPAPAPALPGADRTRQGTNYTPTGFTTCGVAWTYGVCLCTSTCMQGSKHPVLRRRSGLVVVHHPTCSTILPVPAPRMGSAPLARLHFDVWAAPPLDARRSERSRSHSASQDLDKISIALPRSRWVSLAALVMTV